MVDTLLIVGSAFALILGIGQLLVRRRRSSNRWLCALFLSSSLWIAHAAAYRFGALGHLPHLNKAYLPLLCLTGPLWYTYVRSLHDADGCERLDLPQLMPAAACLILSLPFYVQDAAFKSGYVETEVSDVPTATMYLATRLAELTLVWFFVKTLLFLRGGVAIESDARRGAGRFMQLFTLVALLAGIVRFSGSVAGSDTVSVVVPALMAVAVFVGMHLLSYREPLVLNLDHAPRLVRARSGDAATLALYRERTREERWFLDPDLKVRTLARKLGTPPAELSVLINTVSGRNFNEFVNELRIEHARTLLVAEPERSILDIAYASGFNSKSAFYRQFTTLTSLTPAQFRKGAARTIPERH